MTDVRALRLAIEAKLKDRRRLLSENAGLRGRLHETEERNRFLVETLGNPLVNMALDRCADEIVNAILDEALRASSIIAEQTMQDGNYEIGIDIPSLHIRRRLFRQDVWDARDWKGPSEAPIRRIHVKPAT